MNGSFYNPKLDEKRCFSVRWIIEIEEKSQPASKTAIRATKDKIHIPFMVIELIDLILH